MTDKEQTEIGAVEAQLIDMTESFLKELGRERAQRALNKDASLQKDLTIDSLGKVELFHRIEAFYEVELSESVMIQADSLTELAQAIIDAKSNKGQTKPKAFVAKEQETHFDPLQAKTLVEVLLKRAAKEPNRVHIFLQDDAGNEQPITYGKLLENAKKVAHGLQSWDIEVGETIAIMLPTSEDFFYTFFGILLIGAIPVPIYPPFRPDRIEEYAMRAANILKNAEVRLLITFQKAERLSDLLKVFISSLKAVITVDSLTKNEGDFKPVHVNENMPGLIQYTSGSTSLPKGVLLTHQNLLANIRAIGQGINLTSSDVAVSWLPLYHDMGLIGSWLTSFYHANPVVIMSPLSFLSRPERWLWTIHYHRATVTGAPNFAYELCVRRISDKALEGLDLSTWRVTFNGAEAVNPRTLESFIKRFEPYGFKDTTMYPVYGLAETCVALTFPPLNRPPKIDSIDRTIFQTQQRAVPTTQTGQNMLQIVCCGKPLPLHEIKIVDENLMELPERRVGDLHFRGPSMMQGYHNQVEATKAIWFDGWWNSGDLAYLADGEVYITGRKKDVIIKAGRNLYPDEIEEATGQVNGVRKGCVVAFGVTDAEWGTEKLVIVAETKEDSSILHKKIIAEITEKVNVVLGILPDEVLLVTPKTIGKTSSGKLQRAACKQAYLEKKLQKAHLPVSVQVAKIYAKSLGAKLNNGIKLTLKSIYSVYVGALLAISALSLWTFSLFLKPKFFSYICKKWAQIGLTLIGCPIKVTGKEHLKEVGTCVYIANHASYIDAVVLLALLPPGVSFVAKKELLKVPLLRNIMKKLNYITVNRMDFSSNLTESTEIEERLRQGKSVALFPEGGFSYATGLRPFKMGAFKVAVESHTPICPIALEGTRHVMRGDNPLLTPQRINVVVGERLYPASQDWQEVMRLHTSSRQVIADNCGEPAIDY